MLLLTSSADLSTQQPFYLCVLASMDTKLSLMPAAFYLPRFFMEVQGFYNVFMKDRHLQVDETNQIAPFVTSMI